MSIDVLRGLNINELNIAGIKMFDRMADNVLNINKKYSN
jgi:hypothetical protein